MGKLAMKAASSFFSLETRMVVTEKLDYFQESNALMIRTSNTTQARSHGITGCYANLYSFVGLLPAAMKQITALREKYLSEYFSFLSIAGATASWAICSRVLCGSFMQTV
jgi:hypothetical protein